jgi:hypothetical protein
MAPSWDPRRLLGAPLGQTFCQQDCRKGSHKEPWAFPGSVLFPGESGDLRPQPSLREDSGPRHSSLENRMNVGPGGGHRQARK